MAALCLAAEPVACQDVRARAAPDECQWVSLRVAAQKVDSQANFPFHPAHPTAVCTVFPDRRAASGASAGRDVVHRQSAARFPESFLELVRDCPSATAEMARQDALQPPQVPQLLVSQKMAGFPTEPPAVAQLAAPHRALRSAVPQVTADESVQVPEVSQLARTAQRALQQAEQRPRSRQEPELALLEQQAQRLAHLIPAPQEPKLQEQQVARSAVLQGAWCLAQQLAPEFSPPH